MRCFNVTEPELDSIGLLNIISTVAFSLAGASLGFIIDFKKDVMLADKLNEQSQTINMVIDWGGVPVVVILVGIGIAAYWKRGSIVKKIKLESQSSVT